MGIQNIPSTLNYVFIFIPEVPSLEGYKQFLKSKEIRLESIIIFGSFLGKAIAHVRKVI